jgi:EAL domain-containing protein (putative c-di-GMP-specific phosphodiesterase class I)
LNNRKLFITASIGITLFPEDGQNHQTLIKNADIAMYRAKDKGKSGYEHFKPEMNIAIQRRIELDQLLRNALKQNEFLIYYQPQIELSTNRIVGVEALIRWQRSPEEIIPPNGFIPLAEETGLIIPIGEWVLRKACEQTRIWHEAGFKHLNISVNLSAKQFQQKNMERIIPQIVAETGLNANYLTLEITENIVMQNAEQAIAIMQDMTNLGIKFSLDDFGTGYSSLMYLKQFPLDELKIDRSFVSDIPAESQTIAIIKAILSMATNLKIKVVAEGVETKEQLDFLRHHACDKIQGFLYSRPLPADELSQLLQEDRQFIIP